MGLTIHSPGSLATLQDLGRFGYQASGFSPSGAMDTDALRLLNVLLGNDPGEAAIEMTASGITAAFDSDCVFVLTGADNRPMLNDTPVPLYTALCAKAGDFLRCGFAENGIRTYLGVAGGFDIAPVMGSRSTGMKFSVGGYQGRKLRGGDQLGFRESHSTLPDLEARGFEPVDKDRSRVTLRVVFGPQDSRFTDEAQKLFLSEPYRVSASMDRMGIRLEGKPVPSENGYDIISDATATGSIQITNNGLPIILMNDRQTTGGYTKIATVITADLPRAGQLFPGCTVRFEAVTVQEAQKLLREKMKKYASLQKKFRR